MRDPVTILAGRTADRTTYDTLIGLGRKTTNTEERMRYYGAAASALDPSFANETLAIALTDELPGSMIGTLITWVAQANTPISPGRSCAIIFRALTAKQGPSFRNYFPSNLMTNFTDAAHANELANFAPV